MISSASGWLRIAITNRNASESTIMASSRCLTSASSLLKARPVGNSLITLRSALEREYYYHATVILAVDRVSDKSRGKVYVYGAVKGQGTAGDST